MPPEIRVIGVAGMPEVQPGDDLGYMLAEAARSQGTTIEPGDVVVVTQKIVSKTEGRVVSIEGVEPSPLRWRSPKATAGTPGTRSSFSGRASGWSAWTGA